MKLKYIICSIVASLLVGCNDLDTLPEGSTVVDKQRDESNLESQTRGILHEMVNAVGITGAHSDYGIPSMNMWLENDGMDMVSEGKGYNQFGASLTYTNRLYTSSATRQIWQLNYKIIHAANLVISKVAADTEDAELKFYRANALALRAYAYFNLAQVYQFTYVDAKDKPCVPLVDEHANKEKDRNNPRASVEEVYTFIIKDLDEAVELFEEARKGNIERPDKMLLDTDVAHGLRARVRLVMQDFEGALEDAQVLTSSEVYKVYSREEVSKPAFCSIDEQSWIWGLIYNDNSNSVQTGIVNWPSFLCSFVSNGYTTLGGVYRSINSNLYNLISPSDVRSGWFLDGNNESVMLDNNQTYKSFVESKDMPAYCNLKFAPADNNLAALINTQDYPLMRMEEMVLIEAECLAHYDIEAAKDVMNAFVKGNRDVNYDCSFMNQNELLDEVWLQRRIELWGEGFAFQDIMRLNKDIDRRNSNFESDYSWIVPAHSDILLYRIPQAEIEANNAITDDDNNPADELPQAVVTK